MRQKLVSTSEDIQEQSSLSTCFFHFHRQGKAMWKPITLFPYLKKPIVKIFPPNYKFKLSLNNVFIKDKKNVELTLPLTFFRPLVDREISNRLS